LQSILHRNNDKSNEEPHALAIKIPRTVIAEMISHALRDDPEECCGFLLGKDSVVTRSCPTKNVDAEKIRRYSMDPLEYIQVQQDADERGEEFVAIYHSHTFTQAYPSETDVKNAVGSGFTDPYYVLISLVEKTRPIVRAFRINEDKTVEEVVITTDGLAYRGANG
jgi:proteasome lid subunit RPN8/RPN11